jgi:hypothetical protein
VTASPHQTDRAASARGWLGVATDVALAVLGVALGVWGSFLVPARMFGGIEGGAVLLAVGGNFALGVAGSRSTGRPVTAAMPGLGWVVAVLVFGLVPRPEGDVVVPGRLGPDPGVATVGTLFMLGGLAGLVAAVALATRAVRSPR